MPRDNLDDEIDKRRFERILTIAAANLSKSDTQWLNDYIQQGKITSKQRAKLKQQNPSLYMAFAHLLR